MPDPNSKAFPADPDSSHEHRYERRHILGEGGMGVVHLGFDRLIRRDVALKKLREETRSSEELRQRFIHEARLTGQLDHPNILPVYEVLNGPEADGPTVVMKYVEGETYASQLAGLNSAPTEEKLQDALQVFMRVCDAIAFAHERGVIHCDLKPENVMVGKHGQVYVMDWGIALRLRPDEAAPLDAELEDEPSASLSTPGGTFGFMAPEQLIGDWDSIDARTDVYGLGGMLCVLLTGSPPRTDAFSIAEINNPPQLEQRRAMPAIPPELLRIAERALSPSQADRYPSVDALRADVQAFLAGGGWFATRRFIAGDIIIREGDRGADAFIITSGLCTVYKGEGDTKRFVRDMGPGETFGELSMLTGRPRSASVVAKSDVTLKVVTEEALRHELARNPILASFMSALSNRFADLEAQIESG